MLTSVSGFQMGLNGGQKVIPPNTNAFIQEETQKNSADKHSIQSEQSQLAKKAFDALSKQDLEKIQQLKKRDIEVKAHEQAHLNAAGYFATGGANYTYTTGPDGIRYATGGEVNIDTSKIEDNPAATIRKADAIRRASLAPASPSTQDQLIARKATAMAESARIELIQLDQEAQNNSKNAIGIKSDNTEKTFGVEKIIESEKTKESEIENRNSSVYNPLYTQGSLLDLSI